MSPERWVVHWLESGQNWPMGLPVSDETLVLILVVFVLSAALRWTFGSESGRRSRWTLRRLRKKRDYGLLREIATAPSERAALFVQERLRDNGIKATIVPEAGGARLRVMVFPADQRAAVALLLRDTDAG